MAAAALTRFSASPALLIASTQVLKDSAFALMVVLSCVSALLIVGHATLPASEDTRRTRIAILIAAAATAAIAGIRAYFAVLLWFALAVALVIATFTQAAGRRLQTFAFALATLAVLWGAFIIGAGSYYDFYAHIIAKATGLRLPLASQAGSGIGLDVPDPTGVATTLMSIREGFIDSGGDTNLTRTHRGRAPTPIEVASDIAIGLSATFVPIAVLHALSIVSFTGGRGFLAVADVDTVFIDVSLLAIAVVMWRSRPFSQRSVVAVSFLLVLAAATAILMAYTVTNFGTLFRLRLMAVLPAWILPLAVANRLELHPRETMTEACVE